MFLQPTNDEQRLKLIEEIKSRAKACITSRNYPEATRLYTKAMELTVNDNPSLAILHANRSMIYLNMSKASDALVDADEAVKLDSSYLKGYYRQAMAASALNDFTLAKKALNAGLALKPDDKDLLAQLTKTEQRIEMAASAPPPAPKSTVPAATNRVTVSHNGTSSTPSSSTPAAPRVDPASAIKPRTTPLAPTAVASEPSEEDDEKELERLNVRGYKKTADGRTTTFFNHDMDEETKKLIGNIAPKKLEVQGEVITTGNTSGSAWNAAGTYEEKIFTPWATEKLTQSFQSIRLNLVDNTVPPAIKAGLPDLVSVLIEVSGTENLTGHAQVTMNRGKKKQVCDFSVTLNWQMILGFSETSTRPPAQLQGQLSVVDITADREYDIENAVLTKFQGNAVSLSSLPSDLQNAFNKAIKSSDGPLQRELLVQLNSFWDEFRSK